MAHENHPHPMILRETCFAPSHTIHGTGICTYIYHYLTIKESTIHVGKKNAVRPMDGMGMDFWLHFVSDDFFYRCPVHSHKINHSCIFTYIYHILPLKTTIHVGKYAKCR